MTDTKSLNPPASQVLKTVALAYDTVALFCVVTNISEECTPSISREIHGLNHQGSRLHTASQQCEKRKIIFTWMGHGFLSVAPWKNQRRLYMEKACTSFGLFLFTLWPFRGSSLTVYFLGPAWKLYLPVPDSHRPSFMHNLSLSKCDSLLPWRWRQLAPPKCWNAPTRLHRVTALETVTFGV